MKIMHITETVTGGIASYLDEIVERQVQEFGISNIRFVVPEGSAGELKRVPHCTIMPFTRRRRGIFSFIHYAYQVFNIVKAENPDIIHAHSTFAGLASRLLFGGKRHVRLVYCAHGWAFLQNTASWKKTLYANIESILGHYTDVFINPSKNELRKSAAAGISQEKSLLIYHGIGERRGELKKLGFPTDRLNLLFVGRFDTQKGFDILFEAMKKLTALPCHLYVIGASVLEKVEYESNSNVTFLGWLPRDELDSYYNAVDAIVMPSRWEAFGLTALEAMRNSVAVIASTAGALPEVVSTNETGLVYPYNNAECLAETLAALDRETLAIWGANGFKRYRDLFTAERMNNELIALYRCLVERADVRTLRTSEVCQPGVAK
ncbi:MAG: glycosyltransferase family 4 protein [Rhizomicrobium sp.]